MDINIKRGRPHEAAAQDPLPFSSSAVEKTHGATVWFPLSPQDLSRKLYHNIVTLPKNKMAQGSTRVK